MRLACTLAVVAIFNNPGSGQTPIEYQVERVTWGFRQAAGPAWSPEGYLLFCDPPEAKVYKWIPGQKPEVFRANSGKASAVHLDERGRLWLAEAGARQITRLGPKGEMEVVAARFEEKPLNAPADIVVRKDGHAFFTDPAFGAAQDARQLPFHGVYHLSAKGEIEALYRAEARPSGIALSPNGRVLYVAGADERVVRAWDLDRQGKATNGRVLISGIDGVPNGIETDRKGVLWITANDVLAYTPQGQLLHRISVPEKPNNVVVAPQGEGQMLFVTARSSVYRIRFDPKGAARQ